MIMLTATFHKGFSQSSVGIGTTNPNSNAVLELVAGNNDQGFLVPRMTTVQRNNTTFTSRLTTTENGLMIFDSDEGKLYFWFNGQWIASDSELTEGDGIRIVGNVIENTGDTDATDDLTVGSTAGGDLTGTFDNLNVTAIQGNPVDAGAPAAGQILKWNGTQWVLQEDNDNQIAADVPVTPDSDLISTDVQSALQELQGEINATNSDTDPLNETITDIRLVGTVLEIEENGTLVQSIDLLPLQDGTGTDDQTATEVSVATTTDLTST
ncbi:MAG: hypothetical protein AAFO69_05485, partial [Bacteroidota bacterium]